MERRLKKAIESWLAQERSGDPSRAEIALRRVFLRLPLPAPRADFVARVLARLGMSVRVLSAPQLTLRWKVALAACFSLVALVSATLPRVFAELWTGLGPGKLIEFAAGALVGLSGRLAAGITVWDALSSVAGAVSSSLASPTMMTAIAGAALLCALALRWLHGLLLPERNTRYAQPN